VDGVGLGDVVFEEVAFGEDSAVSESMERGVFPREQSAYVSYLTADREQIPVPLVLSQHYLQHIIQSTAGAYPIDFRIELAFAYLAIRNANLALAENPNSSRAFLALGRVYHDLGMQEARFCQSRGIPYDINFRFLQSHMAYHQALIGIPDSLIALLDLQQIALARNKPEPALRMTERLLAGELDLSEEQRANLVKQRDQLEEQINELYDRGQKQIDLGVEPLQVAATLGAQGCPYRALEMFEASETEIPPNSQLKFFQGIFQLETGQIEEAYNTLLTMEPMFDQLNLLQGYRYANWAALGHADYQNALDLKQTETIGMQKQGFRQSLLPTVPLSSDFDLYQKTRYRNWQQFLYSVQSDVVRQLWEQAVYQLEQGENSQAKELLTRAVELSPDSEYRPFLAVYLSALGENSIPVVSPAAEIPIDPEIVPAGDIAAEDSKTSED